MFNSFCVWFGKENAKQEFFSLLGEALFQERRLFKKKIKTGRGKMVLVFSLIVFKSQISLWEAVSKEQLKQHKYLVKLFQNFKCRPSLMNMYI